MEIVELTTCNDLVEANLIKGMLENEGIHCFLTNSNFTTLMPHYRGIMGSGVQIMIDSKDREKALSLLETTNEPWEITCPKCNSKNVVAGLYRNKIGKIITIILSALIWMPFGNIKVNYHCMDCGFDFKV